MKINKLLYTHRHKLYKPLTKRNTLVHAACSGWVIPRLLVERARNTGISQRYLALYDSFHTLHYHTIACSVNKYYDQDKHR